VGIDQPGQQRVPLAHDAQARSVSQPQLRRRPYCENAPAADGDGLSLEHRTAGGKWQQPAGLDQKLGIA
jgi:hypothetical protein